MKKNNLILTPTGKMTREEWLDFRQPMNHVKKFITEYVAAGGPLPVDFWGGMSGQDELNRYNELKFIFQSKEWEQFIFPCIGGSEIATLLGLNPYQSTIELYFEKIGAKDIFRGDNAAMFWGRELEEQIADKWQYWDGSPEGMIDNYTSGNKLRKCRRINFYVQNKACPWIFVSLDRVINKTKSGEETIDEGSLECKTISGFSANMWEAGIPPMYVAQLQAQLIAAGMEYGEMAILKDGRYFEVYQFDKHEEISDRLINESKAFFDAVKFGIAEFILHTYAPADDLKQLHYSNAESKAPEPDDSIAYENYLSSNYKDRDIGGIPGGAEQLEWAYQNKYASEKIKHFETIKRESTNHLKDFLGDHNKIDLGTDGSVTWKVDARGVRSMRVNVKLPITYIPKQQHEEGKTNEEQLTEVAEKTIREDKVADLPFENGEKKPRKKKAAAEESDRGE